MTCLLDPGLEGSAGLAYRCLKEEGAHVMLDYDDFYSHHSTDSIETLFTEATEYLRYDQHLAQNIISSFDNSRVYVHGDYIGKLCGTLMSGHHATTFINAILNEAYILCAYPEAINFFRLHVGDDVYIVELGSGAAQEGCEMVPNSSVTIRDYYA